MFLLGGCETAHHARVDDGAGLAEGSAVMVSGVRVGSVRDVRVVEGEVDVAFVIDDDHDVTLREDSCALALGGEGEPSLVVVPGEGAPLPEDRALPQCELRGQALTNLAEQFGDTIGGLLRSLGSGLLQGTGGGAAGGSGAGGFPIPTLPPTPAPRSNAPSSPSAPPSGSPSAPPSGSPSAPPPEPPSSLPAPPAFGECQGLSVRITSVEPAPAVPLLLPNGGHRVTLEFENTSDRVVRIGTVSDATFVDGQRQALTPATLPGSSTDWFMPFDVPAGGTARKTVHFGTSAPPRLDEVEVRRVSASDGSVGDCTLRSTGLAG